MPTLAMLINETRDVLDSPAFDAAVRSAVDTCLQHSEDNLALRFFTAEAGSSGPSITSVKTARLSALLPHMKKEAEAMFNLDVGPVTELFVLKEVADYSSSIYESFSSDPSTIDIA